MFLWLKLPMKQRSIPNRTKHRCIRFNPSQARTNFENYSNNWQIKLKVASVVARVESSPWYTQELFLRVRIRQRQQMKLGPRLFDPAKPDRARGLSLICGMASYHCIVVGLHPTTYIVTIKNYHTVMIYLAMFHWQSYEPQALVIT